MLTLKEFHRQIIHTLFGMLIITSYYFDLLSTFSILLLIITGVLASILSKRTYVPFFSDFIGHLERDDVKTTFPGRGLIFFLVGALITIKLFDKDIALAALMVLTFGDSVSHIIGSKYGKLKNIFNWQGKKLLEGTICGILTGFFAAWLFVPFPMAFLGSAVAMIAEVIEIDFNQNSLDDNIVVPLIAGTVMFLLRSFL